MVMDGTTYRAEVKPDGESDPAEPAAEETLLAGKYKSEDELMKGTSELLKQKGISMEQFYKNVETGKDPFDTGENPTEEPAPAEKDETPKDETPAEERTAVENLLEENGLSLETFEQEFIENDGELTEESMNKLRKVFPESMINAYIAGNKAQAETYQNTLADEVGGSEAYEQMLEWGANNMSDEEIEEFDNAVKSGDLNKAKRAVKAVAYEYQKANPATPAPKGSNLINADRKSSGGPSGYQTRGEHVKEVQDPRYNSDPAYRRYVEDRLKKTTAF